MIVLLVISVWFSVVVFTYGNIPRISDLSLKEKIGQLLMIAVYPQEDTTALKGVAKLIRKYNIGGIILFKGSLKAYMATITCLQRHARIPLLVAVDGEWGIAMRIREVPGLPRALTLGAIRDPELLKEAGWWTGIQMRLLGIHINMAPVVDVLTEPANPVISWRAWGSDPERVAWKTQLFAEGLRMAGVYPCIKHFPGHGNTIYDSHLRIPAFRGDSAEFAKHLLPFKEHIRNDNVLIMVGHIWVPFVDKQKIPATLSKNLIDGILRKQLGYKGIVITDALNMGAVSKWGEYSGVLALKAGADILLFPEDPVKQYEAILKAIKRGEITEERINKSVEKILALKRQLFGSQYIRIYPVSSDSFRKIAHSSWFRALINKLAENSIVTLSRKGGKRVFPVRDPSRFRWIIVSNTYPKAVINRLQFFGVRYIEVCRWDTLIRCKSKFGSETIVILHLPDNSIKAFSRKFGIDETAWRILNTDASEAVGWIVFGSELFIHLKGLRLPDNIMIAHEGKNPFWQIAIDVSVGARACRGEPALRYDNFLKNWEVLSWNPLRLGIGLPEEVGMSSDVLKVADSLIESWIKDSVFPGAQLLIARDNLIVHYKAYGCKTYRCIDSIRISDLFDLASLTKILATTPLVMKFVDEGRLDLYGTVCSYLEETCDYPVGNLTIYELLTHTGGLPAWIPFYRYYIPDSLGYYFCTDTAGGFCVPVLDSLYAHKSIEDSLWDRILRVQINRRGRYRYSDLGYILLGKILEKVAGERLDSAVYRHIYSKCLIRDLMFVPALHGLKPRTVPTEIDTYFRHSLIWGYVHDPAAALFGGVAGHAGLFGNAYGVASMMYVYARGGECGGARLFSEATVKKFTSYQSRRHRRGLGFDKPAPAGSRIRNTLVCDRASEETFGHLGFTGTAVWYDPHNQLMFVFLSNATYPSMWHRKINEYKVRETLHCLAYESLHKGEEIWRKLITDFSIY